MSPKTQGLALAITLTFLSQPAVGGDTEADKAARTRVETARSESAVLWREPVDIASRNLLYGPGGEKHQPKGPYTFVEEDLNGTNPKYVVRGPDKVKWTVKLGLEARPETVSTRLVWAAGYFATEDYFLQDIQVEGMPAHLKRGGNLVGPGGTMHAARLKRHMDDEKNLDIWSWREGPWTGTRELNGLKVMMALINNWDLKDVNNEIRGVKDGPGQTYIVSDLGASFGAPGLSFPFSRSRDNLNAYVHSKFIAKATGEYVDFRTPSRPALIYMFGLPAYLRRVHMEQVTHRVPRADVQWIGHVLSGLSADQIRDAFRAAGYTPAETDTYCQALQGRIAQLNTL